MKPLAKGADRGQSTLQSAPSPLVRLLNAGPGACPTVAIGRRPKPFTKAAAVFWITRRCYRPQMASSIATNASWPGSSRPTLLSANIRARPTLQGRSRNSTRHDRPAAMAAAAISAGNCLPDRPSLRRAWDRGRSCRPARLFLAPSWLAARRPIAGRPRPRVLRACRRWSWIDAAKLRRSRFQGWSLWRLRLPGRVYEMSLRYRQMAFAPRQSSLSKSRRSISPVSPSPSAASASEIVASISRRRPAARRAAAATCCGCERHPSNLPERTIGRGSKQLFKLSIQRNQCDG